MKKMNYLYKGYFTVIKGYVYGLLAFLGVGILLSIPMMLMWNWLMPFIFGLPKLNLLQTFGLSVLVNMFTSKLDINTKTVEDVGSLTEMPALTKQYLDLKKELESIEENFGK